MPPNDPLAYLLPGGGRGAPRGGAPRPGAGGAAGGAPRPPGPGGAGAPNPGLARGAVEGNRSVFNRTDAAVLSSRFQGVDESTPLIELLPMIGLDPQAPGIPQLKRLAQGQIQGIDPLSKMSNIASGQNATATPPPPTGAPPGAPPAAAPPLGAAGGPTPQAPTGQARRRPPSTLNDLLGQQGGA